jgi:hypothetical protein
MNLVRTCKPRTGISPMRRLIGSSAGSRSCEIANSRASVATASSVTFIPDSSTKYFAASCGFTRTRIAASTIARQ